MDWLGLIPREWVVTAVFAYIWWLERSERKEVLKLWREERDQITSRIVTLADALKDLKLHIQSSRLRS